MNQTACKLDSCSPKHVYKYLDVLKWTLTKMVNLSLRQGLFIKDWKLAIVKPLIKKKKKHQSGYRILKSTDL